MDWLSYGFTSHSTQNRSFQRCFPPWLGTEKLNLTQQKHTFTNQRNVLQHKINKKLKPGLVASYDIWPGNGEGLFLFRHFLNLSLTYFDTYPLTAPGPTQGMEIGGTVLDGSGTMRHYRQLYVIHIVACSQSVTKTFQKWLTHESAAAVNYIYILYTMDQKTTPYYFSNNSCQKWTNF